MNPPQTLGCVVITGSSKGIGFALADAFLQLGYPVVISGRHLEALNIARQKLNQKFSTQQLHAVCCDVTSQDAALQLWHEAIQHFEHVTIWINNAGSCTASLDFIDIPPKDITQVIHTNVIGSMLGAQVALKNMLQQGHGQIFNMEGWGSHGEWSHGMTVYSTSKAAIHYFSKALYKEARGSKIQVGTLSPGMVTTELLISSWTQGNPKHWNQMKRLFKFIIDPPETVASYLAQQMIQNQKMHSRIAWMTPWRLLMRFFRPYYWRRNPLKDTDLDHF